MSDDKTSILGVAIRDVQRLAQVSGVVARHGFGSWIANTPLRQRVFPQGDLPEQEASLAGESSSVRLRKLLEALGPTYIKLGQILSMRPDLLPQETIDALSELQDRAPQLNFPEVRQVVESGLGRPIEDVFEEFSEAPLATASIGQTHVARLPGGREVVVKVQRPGIEEVMRGDLDLLYLGARILEAGIDELQIAGISGAIAEFEAGLLRELNFTSELSNLQTARQFLDPDNDVVVPEPFPEFSSRTVLTMECFRGQALRSLEPSSELAKTAVEAVLRSYARQVLIDGFFHGDPHAGNFLVDDHGKVCMIDLGLVGRLTPAQREDIISLLMAAITNDPGTIARVFLRMGHPTERVNLAEFKAEITRIRGQYLEVGDMGQVDSGKFVEEFMGAAHTFRIKLNRDYALLIKAVASLEGIVRALHPEVDVVGIVRPTAEEVLATRYGPRKLLEEVASGISGVGGLLRQLPDQLDQVLHDVETGNLQVRAVTPSLDPVAPMIHQLGGRLVLGLFAASLTVSAALLHGLAPASRTAIVLCGVGAALSWIVLLLWHLLGRGRAVKLTPWIELFRR